MEVTDTFEEAVIYAAVLLSGIEETIVATVDVTLDIGVGRYVVLDIGSRKTAKTEAPSVEDLAAENLNITVVEFCVDTMDNYRLP